MRFYGMALNCGRLAVAFGLLAGSCGLAQAGSFYGAGGFQQGGGNVTDYFGNSVGVTQGNSGVLATYGGDQAYTSQGGAFLWKNGYVTDNSTQPLTIGPAAAPAVTALYPTALQVNNLVTYCLQLNQPIPFNGNNGPYSVTSGITSIDGPNSLATAPNGAGPAMGNTAALYLSELWHNDSGFALSTSHTSTIGANTYTADIVNAAFQLAIWKLEYDAGTNAGSAGLTNADAFATAGSAISANTSTTWTTGNLRATGDANIIGLATYMLNHLAAVDATNEDSSLWALVSPAGQDQLFGNEVPTPNVNSNPVPEPASMVTWLLLGSVAGFAGMRRRRKIAA